MLTNLQAIVRSGVIDNTQQGITKLTLYTGVGGETVQMQFEGNCLGDAAGRKTKFRAKEQPELHPEPIRARIYRKVVDLLKNAQRQFTMGDMAVLSRENTATNQDELVIEFFYDREIRFLIESSMYDCGLSSRAWELDEREEEKQKILNLLALRNHVAYNAYYFDGPTMQSPGADFPFCKWDRILNCAEGYNTIAQTLWHKYPDTPYGRLRAAYVLNLIRLNNPSSSKGKKKKVSSRKEPIRLPKNGRCSFADFLLPQENELFLKVMSNSLYKASFDFFEVVQKELIKLARSGWIDEKSELIYADASSLSGHLLATLLLLAEDEKELDVAQTRSRDLLKRCKKLQRLTSYWSEDVRRAYSDTLSYLQSELQTFIASHKA